MNIPPTRDIQSELIANQRLPEDQLKKLMQLKDLFDKILVMDASKRINIKQAMMHPFVDDKWNAWTPSIRNISHTKY